MTRSSFQQINVKANFIACELVKRVVTFGVVLYVTNGPLISFCIFLNCRLVVLSKNKNTLFAFYFLKCNIKSKEF